jgi:hypothetical protein
MDKKFKYGLIIAGTLFLVWFGATQVDWSKVDIQPAPVFNDKGTN